MSEEMEGMIADREELKRSYEELLLAYEELKKTDQTKTDFVTVVTHELRTPLAVIRNNLEMLLDGTFGDLSEIQMESMDRIFKNVERMIKLVSDSLEMSRIYGNRLKLKYNHVELQDIFEKVVAEMKIVAEDKEHDITLEILQDIPVVTCDEDRITQVLTNLLHNAIKFTPAHGKISVSLNVDQIKGESYAIAEVSDNGVGIPKEDHEEIFKQFYGTQKSTTNEPSTGLGLSIVKGVIEAHGGEVKVRSIVGDGTTFSFTIPVGGNL
ncbi:MAG: HAMP domain-containing sensor histidine kinase [Halobacteriota archaeon]|nr:HAMP domain-containing sensor histidine kinase [Halobacteriota archaeon]